MTSRAIDPQLHLITRFVVPEELDPSRQDDVEQIKAVTLGRNDGVLRIRTNGKELRCRLKFFVESDAKSGIAARSAAVGAVIAVVLSNGRS